MIGVVGGGGGMEFVVRSIIPTSPTELLIAIAHAV